MNIKRPKYITFPEETHATNMGPEIPSYIGLGFSGDGVWDWKECDSVKFGIKALHHASV